MEIFFATSNLDKFAECAKMLVVPNVVVRHFHFVHNEIRSDSLEEIAREAAAAAYEKCRAPVFVEDAGLFVNALNGFPGPYSGWIFRRINNQGILRLLEGRHDRSAYFQAAVAFHDGKDISVFMGRCDGAIAMDIRGGGGFGYDPIFIPAGHSQTFAENIELKNKLSHRYKSLLEFSKSLESRR